MRTRYRKKEHLFLKDKPYRILKRLNREEISYASSLATDTNSTYTHVIHILQDFEKLDLIETRWDGRTKLVKITEKGQELAKLMKSMEEYVQGLTPKQEPEIEETREDISIKMKKLKEVKQKLKELDQNFEKYARSHKYADIARKVGAYKKQFKVIKSSNEDLISFKNELEELAKTILIKFKKTKSYNSKNLQ